MRCSSQVIRDQILIRNKQFISSRQGESGDYNERSFTPVNTLVVTTESETVKKSDERRFVLVVKAERDDTNNQIVAGDERDEMNMNQKEVSNSSK